jgi:hypothetical protein
MADFDRAFPHVAVRHNVACQSERNHFGVTIPKPTLIILHDTEGANVPHSARDLVGLGNYFDVWATQASSHVATDADGTSARYVPDEKKAWTQAYYNSMGLSIEQIGFATDNWRGKEKELQLRETARWIAYWSRKYDIPMRTARVTAGGTVTRSGVLQHRRLGALGGGHVDVHVTFPISKVLRYARHYADLQERHDEGD